MGCGAYKVSFTFSLTFSIFIARCAIPSNGQGIDDLAMALDRYGSSQFGGALNRCDD
jgi:hypothetical protein